MEAVLPPEPGDVYGDSAFAGSRSERAIAVRRGRPQMVKTGTWGGPDALACRQRHMQGCSVCALAFEKLAFCPASVFLLEIRWSHRISRSTNDEHKFRGLGASAHRSPL
jgi:hypothetical protein